MLHRPNAALASRRGVILLVVVALLTLFAVVGISFVLYSSAQATSSRLAREQVAPLQPDMDPELLLAYFLGQLLYDADDVSGVYSGLRGHSLGRTMYGFNGVIAGSPPQVQAASSDPLQGNVTPYNGVGRLHGTSAFPNQDDYYLVNYTYFQSLGEPLRDPERSGGPRPSPGSPYAPNSFVGCNASYTYPDLNNMFLAAVRADGTVLMPSFHRHWLFNDPGKTFNDPTNTHWTSPEGKYRTLRPRPQEMGPGFPLPEDPGGDVKNLIGSPGYLINGQYANNDSVWIDLGAPVMTAPDGTRFKPLFAALVTDLDNRLNLNVHGNVRGRTGSAGTSVTHTSNQGWGPWEVSIQRVLGLPGSSGAAEWSNLFLGAGAVVGRYGADGKPGGTTAPSGTTPHFYALYDFDGCHEQGGYGPTGQARLPGPTSFAPFPTYPPGYGSGSAYECLEHPAGYNVVQPAGDDRVFGLSHLEALLRYGDTGSPALTSDLFRLCPGTFTDSRPRSLVTLHSADLDRPGVTPWVWDPTARPYQLDPTVPIPFPWGYPINYPAAGQPPPPGSEFGPDRRAVSAGLAALLRRVDLNRPLTPYPTPDPSTNLIAEGDWPLYQQAVQDRQQLAADIFAVLRATTGAADPATVPVSSPPYNAVRALAQLAVNIVDYIDADDYLTPFNWYGGEYVFGTELPRLVINEAYVEFANDPKDPGLTDEPPKALSPYKVNFWVELHNPLGPDPSLSDGGAARLQTPGAPYSIYQLWICNADPTNALRQPANVLGDPPIYAGPLMPQPTYPPLPTGNPIRVVSDFVPDPDAAKPTILDYNQVRPANGAYAGPPGSNVGFYVLAPKATFPTDPQNPGPAPAPPITPTLHVKEQTVNGYASGMSYDWPVITPLPPAGGLPRHMLLLRRLACPHLPPNPPGPGMPPTSGPLNPYVTVDYLDRVPSNDGVRYDAAGNPRGGTNDPALLRTAFGRNQPYAAHWTQQNPQVGTATNQPQHTFFRHNAVETPGQPVYPPNQTLRLPFGWLCHLDRPLVNQMELLQVSAYKPHELTQQFMVLGQPPFGQRAPWRDEDLGGGAGPSHRLYRALEMFTTPPRGAGVAANGRVLGRLNINTMWDPEPLLALADPQPGNVFGPGDIYNADDPTDLNSLFGQLVRHRTPGMASGGGPGPLDQPFTGLAAAITPAGDAQYPGGSDLGSTLLAPAVVTASTQSVSGGSIQSVTPETMAGPCKGQSWAIQPGWFLAVDGGPAREVVQVLTADATSFTANFTQDHAAGFPIRLLNGPRLFGVAGEHPYVQDQLLTKIFNQVTTRSNVFAVWLTVGFFEVTDETTRPVKLGAEIGRAENRHVRRRMFAIVDRTGLTTDVADPRKPGPAPIFLNGSNGVTAGAGQVVAVDGLSGTADGFPWLIEPGARLVVDVGPTQEVITVTSVQPGSPPTFTADFTQAHTPGFLIVAGPARGGKAGPPGVPGNPGPQPRFDPRAGVGVVRYFSVIN